MHTLSILKRSSCALRTRTNGARLLQRSIFWNAESMEHRSRPRRTYPSSNTLGTRNYHTSYRSYTDVQRNNPQEKLTKRGTTDPELLAIPVLYNLKAHDHVNNWLKNIGAIINKYENKNTWQELVRTRTKDPRALALIELVPSFEEFGKRILALCPDKRDTQHGKTLEEKDERYTQYCRRLVERLRTPKSPLVHLRAINHYTLEIEKLIRNQWKSQQATVPVGSTPEEARDNAFKAMTSIVNDVIARDCLGSVLAPHLDQWGWDKQKSMMDAKPADIANWAQTKCPDQGSWPQLEASPLKSKSSTKKTDTSKSGNPTQKSNQDIQEAPKQ